MFKTNITRRGTSYQKKKIVNYKGVDVLQEYQKLALVKELV